MKKLLLAFLLFALLVSGAVQAQDELPLTLWIRGDLYSYQASGEAPIPLTSNGTISGPALSPTGGQIAYKAASPVGVDALNRVEADGFIADFDLPGDIYIYDAPSRASVQIAGQPADASLFVDGIADHATIRSAPVWSPDGTQLAWTEYDYPNGAPSIIVYTLANNAPATLVTNIPAPLVQGAPPAVRWGRGGIAVNASTDAAGEQAFLIYATDGRLLASPRLAPVPDDQALDFVWVESPNGSLLGILYDSARWITLNGETGVAQAVTELPRMTTTAEGTRALTFGVEESTGFFWEIVGETAAAAGSPTNITLSPSGRQLAFIGFPSSGAVSVWTDGETTSIPNTGSNLEQLQVGAVLWGYTYWRIG
jgi:hypothetical protein